jgi:uncharacterized protein (TIGR03435 family)
VSIRRTIAGEAGGGLRTTPDGGVIMTNSAIRSIIMMAAPSPVREVVGAPDWVMTERYDITARPPAGATRAQQGEMMRAMFAERMRLVAHVEERERDTFALVLARPDGSLGPNLKPSTLDCGPRPAGAPPAPPSPPESDPLKRCGASFSGTRIMSGAVDMDRLVPSLGGLAGGLVNNRTGLKGFYSVDLTFSRPGLLPTETPPELVDAPEFFTALQEQLGLRLEREKTMVPVLVIDSIERPSEN